MSTGEGGVFKTLRKQYSNLLPSGQDRLDCGRRSGARDEGSFPKESEVKKQGTFLESL